MDDAPLLGVNSDEAPMSPLDWRFNSVHADTWENVLLAEPRESRIDYDAAVAAVTALPTIPPPLLSQEEMSLREKLRAGYGCLKLRL
eukprot:gene7184-26756_t